jgi:hypothetical protein
VVGCCAFEITDGDPFADELPCLWKRLRKLVSKNRTKAGKKLHVNDSKVVYTAGAGIKELERSILAILTTMRAEACDELDTLVHALPLTRYRTCADTRGTSPMPASAFPLEQDLTLSGSSPTR